MVNEYKIAFFYLMDLVNTCCLAIHVACKPRLQEAGDPLNTDGRRKFHARKVYAKLCAGIGYSSLDHLSAAKTPPEPCVPSVRKCSLFHRLKKNVNKIYVKIF